MIELLHHPIDLLRGTVAIVFMFSFAIFIHELGHFFFAKLFGVKVETFSIGFGKKLFTVRRGDTDYCISAIPFGGYVKMIGIHSKEMEQIIEGEKAASATEEAEAEIVAAELSAPAPLSMSEGIVAEVDALRSKWWWQKILIFSAGCINNFLTAVFIFFMMAWIGYHKPPETPAMIADIEYARPEQVELKQGDRITGVEGTAVDSYYDFIDHYKTKAKDAPVTSSVAIQIERNGTTMTLKLPVAPPFEPVLPPGRIIEVDGKKAKSDDVAQEIAISLLLRSKLEPIPVKVQNGDVVTSETVSPVSIARYRWPELVFDPADRAFISDINPNLPADKAGLIAGDEIVSVNGKPTLARSKAITEIGKLVGKQVPVGIIRTSKDGTTESLTKTMEIRPNPDDPQRGQIGVAFGGGPRTEFVKKPFAEALAFGFTNSTAIVKGYLRGVSDLFTRSSFQTIREGLGGPVAIARRAVVFANRGLIDYLGWFAIFSIILAITNLLPLPIFDGGHILFCTIEAIIRRPLPARFMLWVYNVFLVLIIGLAVLITFNDVIMNFWLLL